MAHLNSGAVAADMIMSSTPAAANSPPVYNSTTIPLNGKEGGYQDEPQQKESMGGGGGGRGEEKYELRTFNNLPERTPVDIQFKDISYCVKAGFRKGELARGLR